MLVPTTRGVLVPTRRNREVFEASRIAEAALLELEVEREQVMDHVVETVEAERDELKSSV